MSIVRMSITVPEWMYQELELGRTSNKSAKMQELIMRGYFCQNKHPNAAAKKEKENDGQVDDGVMGIFTPEVQQLLAYT